MFKGDAGFARVFDLVWVLFVIVISFMVLVSLTLVPMGFLGEEDHEAINIWVLQGVVSKCGGRSKKVGKALIQDLQLGCQ